jgi:hypothetical protein
MEELRSFPISYASETLNLEAMKFEGIPGPKHGRRVFTMDTVEAQS